jgi:type III restriction enzyme
VSNRPGLYIYDDLIAEIAARLDLRAPNRDAVADVSAAVSQYYDVEDREPPYEAVVDVATGVGKTYILAGCMELLYASHGVRDFVVVVPRTPILTKTRNNFTPGAPKSLADPLSFEPVVITADNFNTPAMRAAMDDDTKVKLYLFTVQSLIRPESKQARRVHKFQEGLGSEFYAHLQGVERLVVFADEHHAYYGPGFSKAVRDLHPWFLLGLTATPDRKTPQEQIIHKYPLAAAIADKFVKTPVIVGRKDDRKDPLTKLADGVLLLQAKAEAIDAYVAATGASKINPVMLVVAKDIADADEYGAILRSDEFFAGAYANSVLVVHSTAPDEALEALAAVEAPDSPVRIIISVGMLKEGWDVSNVYVIASMRASVSEILTEQTLGRGMRLPFGAYTDQEILDTLEVLAHERYEELLKKAKVLNQVFIDFRTRLALRVNEQGQQVVVPETFEVSAPPIVLPESEPLETPATGEQSAPAIINIQQRVTQVSAAGNRMKQQVMPRHDVQKVRVPRLSMSKVENTFSLADIAEVEPFRRLGLALATNPDDELSRVVLRAQIVTGPDGIKRTAVGSSPAADRLKSSGVLFPVEQLRSQLVEFLLAAPCVPARKNERAAAAPILDALFDGLGDKAAAVLSSNMDRAAARLIRLVEQEQRKFMARPSYNEVVDLIDFAPPRVTDKPLSDDRFGAFSRSVSYDDWQRSLYPLAWFDSEPERRVANMVDGDDEVEVWLRLHTGDLPILWNSGGQEYNPDLIVMEGDGTHWLVEVKMDREMKSAEVQSKREHARRWANHVSADPSVGVQWRYLLTSEDDVNTAKGSWDALKRIGS